jgi:hypothetical protein
MSEITVRRVKAATDEEIERMTSVLVDAFHGGMSFPFLPTASGLMMTFTADEFTRWMVGGDMGLVPLIKKAQVRMALIGGEVRLRYTSLTASTNVNIMTLNQLFVAGFGPDDISSVAVWFGPGQEALSRYWVPPVM